MTTLQRGGCRPCDRPYGHRDVGEPLGAGLEQGVDLAHLLVVLSLRNDGADAGDRRVRAVDVQHDLDLRVADHVERQHLGRDRGIGVPHRGPEGPRAEQQGEHDAEGDERPAPRPRVPGGDPGLFLRCPRSAPDRRFRGQGSVGGNLVGGHEGPFCPEMAAGECLGGSIPGMPMPQRIEVAAARLVAHIRRFRPHVLLTYDEKGGYPHPDHIMCHRVSMAAVSMAADPKAVPEAGPVWQVKKVYYHMGGHRNRFMRLDELMHEHGLEPVYTERLASFPDDQRAYRLTTFIPCADFFSVRDDALRAHATQIDPDGHWFAVPSEIQKMGWPTEDYQLVLSTVPTVIPEGDLFSGIAVPNPALAPDYSI